MTPKEAGRLGGLATQHKSPSEASMVVEAFRIVSSVMRQRRDKLIVELYEVDQEIAELEREQATD